MEVMGSGKGKTRRTKSQSGRSRTVVNKFDILPDAKGTSTKAFVDEEFPVIPVELAPVSESIIAMSKIQASGKEGPTVMTEDYGYYRDVADSLGVPIPEEDPYYCWSFDVGLAQNLLANALANGHRSFSIYGPPGTGKNTFIKQAFAALTHQPVFEMDVASSDELEAAIGYDGIDVVEGDDGSVASKTVEKRGKLTRLAAKGGIIVLNEITELPRGQLTAIHNMIGSGLGDGERYIVIKSPNSPDKEMMIPVHPDTCFFFTYNPERSDRRPHEALLSRTLNLHLGHGDEKAEADILSARTNAVLANNKEFIAAREAAGKPTTLTAEDVKPTVGFMRTLRAAYRDDGLQHEPDMRTAVMFEACRQAEDAKGRKAGILFVLHQLDFMFDQSMDTPQERMSQLQKYASNFFSEIEDMGGFEGNASFTDPKAV